MAQGWPLAIFWVLVHDSVSIVVILHLTLQKTCCDNSILVFVTFVCIVISCHRISLPHSVKSQPDYVLDNLRPGDLDVCRNGLMIVSTAWIAQQIFHRFFCIDEGLLKPNITRINNGKMLIVAANSSFMLIRSLCLLLVWQTMWVACVIQKRGKRCCGLHGGMAQNSLLLQNLRACI